MDALLNDLRYARRTLVKAPAFTLAAVVALTLGIGANTAIFSLFDALLLDSLPVPEPSRLALSSTASGEGTSVGDQPSSRWVRFSTEVYEFLRRQPLGFESLAAFRSGEDPVAIRLPGETPSSGRGEPASAHLVSGTYFTVMGVRAAIGRVLVEDDDRPNAAPAAVVSDGFWKRRLHSDPGAVGTVAILNGTSFTIVGITPPEFFGERVRRPPDFWLPLAFQPQIELRPSFLERSDVYWLGLIGRLSNGATRPQAQTATTAALRQFLTNSAGAKLTPERQRTIQESHVVLEDGSAGISGLRQLYSAPLRVLLGVVLLVLLIACANVGNLLLSRAAARQGEVSVRIALGATRGRLVRQFLTESLLLAAIGAVCGLLLARWLVQLLMRLITSPTTPVHASLNGSVLAFTIAVAFAAGILFGLVPALRAGRTDVVSAMRSGSRGVASRRRGRGAPEALVAAQIAVSLVLLVGAGLFARSLLNLQQQALGFDRDHVLVARINPRLASYRPASVGVLYRKLYDRVNALPGVRAATMSSYGPFSGSTMRNSARIEGYTPKPGEDVDLETIFVGPSYPDALGIPLRQGRAIGVQDGPDAPLVAMVNEQFGRQYFPNQNPIGHRFTVESPKPYEIVGVLADAQFHDVKEPIKPVVFLALLQEQSQFALSAEVQLRTADSGSTAVPPVALASSVRQAVTDVDRNVPVSDPRPLADQVSAAFDTERLAARLVSFFGILAVVLACVGLYGVVSQAVARRTNEIGVRMALGANQRDVLWLILRDTLALVALGLLVGVPAALGASRLVRSQLFGLNPADPASFAGALAALTLVAALAGLVPARRAARVDPMIALREN